MAQSQEHLRGLCATHPDELGLYHGTGDDCVPACGRCAGHGTIQGIRFNMDDSPVESYREPCPQCMGSGESGFVHCFYGCGFVVRDISPFEAHHHMEDHFEVAHRDELEKLGAPKPPSRWDLWWYCDGTEEVYYEKPDDCGDPGSYRRHDACRWVRLDNATPAEIEAAELSEAAQDWAEDAYDRDYQGGDS